MAAVVPAIDPASNRGNGGRTLQRRSDCTCISISHFSLFHNTKKKWVLGLPSINGHLLPLKAIVASQQPLVLLVCTELDGSIWDDSHHGGRVPPPQTEEAILQVGAVDQPVGLLKWWIKLEFNFEFQLVPLMYSFRLIRLKMLINVAYVCNCTGCELISL